MDMSLREWLIVIGIIIILGILIDGYRRMRRARSDADNMSRSMNGDNFSESTPLDEDFNPELPGGGARVVRPGIDSASGDAAFDATKYGANYQPPKARVVQRESDSGVGEDSVGAEPGSGLQQPIGDKPLSAIDVKNSDQNTWAASPGADELEPFFLDQDAQDMHFDGHVKAESGIAQSHLSEDIDDEEPPVLDTRVVTPEPDRFILNNDQGFSDSQDDTVYRDDNPVRENNPVRKNRAVQEDRVQEEDIDALGNTGLHQHSGEPAVNVESAVETAVAAVQAATSVQAESSATSTIAKQETTKRSGSSDLLPEQPTKKYGFFSGRIMKGRKVEEKSRKQNKPAQEVIIINVMSKDPEGFKGVDLQRLFEACGMEHGEMAIFHRHEEIESSSPVQFSVANACEPGYFDVETIERIRTPGVSFFMSLPGPSNNMRAFDYMVETAQCVVKNLKGEMKDERRSVFTPQTLEHCKQRIREFERKQQLSVHH